MRNDGLEESGFTSVLHIFAEDFRTILRRMAILEKAKFDLKFQIYDFVCNFVCNWLEISKGKMFRVFPSGVKNGIMES